MILRLIPLLLLSLAAARPGYAQCPSSPTLVETIVDATPTTNATVGYSAALLGDRLALASLDYTGTNTVPWSVSIFDRASSGTWSEIAEVTHPEGDGLWGLDLAFSGDTLFVGDPSDSTWEGDLSGTGAPYDEGVVHVFERHHGGPDAWGEAQTLVPSKRSGIAWFGGALAAHEDTLVVTASYGGSGGNGAAFIYKRLAQGWHIVDEIRAFPGATLFGSDVAVGPGRIVIGAERTNSDTGMVAVYEQDTAGKWRRTALLQPSGPPQKYFFGASVALSGDRIAVGAPAGPVSSVNAGRVRIWDLDPNGVWVETKIIKPAQNLFASARFGTDVALSGDTLMASAPYMNNSPAWIFDRKQGGPNGWGEVLKHTPSGYGRVFAIDGDRGVIGGPGAVVNGVASGAGFLYEGLAGNPIESYCTAGTSSSGCSAVISAAGCASATAGTGFTLSATGLDGAVQSEFLFGTNGRQATPWGTGSSFQCVLPPWRRTGLQIATGTPGLCDGTLALDLNSLWCPSCPRPGKNPGAGAVVQAQLSFFDANTQTTTLSDAVEFTLGP